jgi:hypothetical protein
MQCINFCSAILNFVLEGNALKAIELTEELAPKLLENDMDLHFDLLSLHFIELIRARKWWVLAMFYLENHIVTWFDWPFSLTAQKLLSLARKDWHRLGKFPNMSRN